MKWLYQSICLPLLHVSNNVYTFLSGIAISLATNIFTSICIDGIGFGEQWNLYVSTISFAIVSALLLLMATNMVGFQNFMLSSDGNYDKNWRDTIVLEATEDDYKKWVIRIGLLLLFLILGITFLATDFAWLFVKA